MNLTRLVAIFAHPRSRPPRRRPRNFWACPHPQSSLTFPRRPRGGKEGSEYVVCLECGKELSYDWSRMKQGKERT